MGTNGDRFPSASTNRLQWIIFTLIFLSIVVYAGDKLGEYTCGYCNVGSPDDAETLAFIGGVVNQDIEQWGQGDYVLITNPNIALTGEWTFTGASIFNLTDVSPADEVDPDPPADDPE